MELTQKGEVVTRLQVKASQIGKILSNLEKKGNQMTDSQISAISSFNSLSPPNSAGASGPPSKKAYLKIGTIPPFNANKLRKSPSAGVTKATESSVAKSSEKSKTAPNSAEDGENKSIEQAQEAKPSQQTPMTDEPSKTN